MIVSVVLKCSSTKLDFEIMLIFLNLQIHIKYTFLHVSLWGRFGQHVLTLVMSNVVHRKVRISKNLKHSLESVFESTHFWGKNSSFFSWCRTFQLKLPFWSSFHKKKRRKWEKKVSWRENAKLAFYGFV